MAIASFRRIIRSNGGAAAVEFAIIAWALIFVCLGVIEFGRGLQVRNDMAFAADFAARLILTAPKIIPDPEDFEGKLEEAVRKAFTGPRPDDLIVLFGEEAANGVQFRTMLITYPFSLLIPELGGTITLTVSRRVPVG